MTRTSLEDPGRDDPPSAANELGIITRDGFYRGYGYYNAEPWHPLSRYFGLGRHRA
jgi:hypothetical protein